MTGNLLETLQHLQALSHDHAPETKGLDPRLQSALGAFWGNQPAKAAEAAASLLADDPEGLHRFGAYRLWIESLAELKDKVSLRAVAEHLFLRGQAEPHDHETYAALRGLAHLELDEFSAARLLARSMADATHNPYCLELSQLVTNRTDEELTPVPALATATAPIEDYFHWQTLCRGLLLRKEEDALVTTLDYVKDHYRNSPLQQLFAFHRLVDRGFFAAAALVAERLVELYPECTDYRYYHAFALFEDGDYPTARKTLQETVRFAGEGDAEVIGLLGHCHAKLGNADQAVSCLRKAVAILKAQGLPTSHISLELANVEDELRGDQPDPVLTMPREPQNWLIKLSPRRYNELLTSSDSTIDRLLRPMGSKPLPGDYCFFASADRPDERGRAVWKVVAVYAVDSEPMWHPTAGWHSALKLVTRLPLGVPVDIQMDDEVETRDVMEDDVAMLHHLAVKFGAARKSQTTGRGTVRLSREDPFHYGVYQIDAGALDLIEEAVKMQRDDMIERRRSSQSRRPTA